MRLAISNIAWDVTLEPQVLTLLRRLRREGSPVAVEGIEVAPTKYWPDWIGAAPAAARERAGYLADAGFCVPSFQSIVFGRPGLSLFDSPSLFIEHLRLVASLAQGFGAGRLVYGAPKTRLKGTRSWEQAVEACVPTLREVGRICADHNCVFVIEPNPVDYGCDFITNASEGCQLVAQVDHPGVRLHLDCAGMFLAGDSVESALKQARTWLAHAHLSEPNLGDFSKPTAPQARMLRVLKEVNYEGWVAIEMRQAEHALEAIEGAVRHVQHHCWGD